MMRKNRWYSLSIALLLIALIGVATSCVTNNQGNVGESIQVLPTGGTLLYEDDFSDPESGWSVENTGEVERGYKNEEYHFRLKKTNWMYWIWNKKTGLFTDFVLNVDARLASEPRSNYYGLIFRHKDDNNFYRFMVRGDGYYFIGTRMNGGLNQLQGWTKTPHIKEGTAENRLTVVCKGSQINLFINGKYLTTLKDESFSSGHVGIIVGSPQAPMVYSAFDNIQVYSLD
jgi:hypothetical protein